MQYGVVNNRIEIDYNCFLGIQFELGKEDFVSG